MHKQLKCCIMISCNSTHEKVLKMTIPASTTIKNNCAHNLKFGLHKQFKYYGSLSTIKYQGRYFNSRINTFSPNWISCGNNMQCLEFLHHASRLYTMINAETGVIGSFFFFAIKWDKPRVRFFFRELFFKCQKKIQ